MLVSAVGLAVVASAGPVAAQYGGTQGFIVDPPVINSGSEIALLGTGCEGESSVVFTIEPLGITLGETTPDPNGDFYLPNVPIDLDPGIYPITATCGDLILVAQITVLAGDGLLGGIDTDGDGIPDQFAFTGASTTIIKLAAVALTAGVFFVLVARRRQPDLAPRPVAG